MTKSNSRLRQQCSKLYKIVVGVLSLAPCYVRKKQVRDKGVPSSYHSKWWSVFVEWWLHHCSPLPCKLVKTNQKFYICSDGTHTHNLSTHNFSTHTQLVHTQLVNTHKLSTHNLLTHTTCPLTTCHHNLLTHTTCPHTTHSHTHTVHTQLTHHTTCHHTT